jgi:hypothetical protein
MDVVESVGNTLHADIQPDSITLTEDSDAVTSTFSRELQKMGARLSNAQGEPSILYRGLQMLVVAMAAVLYSAVQLSMAASSGMAQPNDLIRVTAALWAAAFALALLPLGSSRGVLVPETGALSQLGAGTQRISAANASQLQRYRVVLSLLSALIMAMGLNWLLFGVIGMDLYVPRSYTPLERIFHTLLGLFLLIVVPLLASGWWHSMQIASCLCRDNIIEVIKHVESSDLASDGGVAAWDASVVSSALGLIDSMAILSDGWSSGVLGLGGMMGLSAFALFSTAINKEYCDGLDSTFDHPPGQNRNFFLSSAVCLAFLPLGLALDLATTSSHCNLLMERLNAARIKHGQAHNERISWLCVSLEKLNCTQGLGFMLGHKVIDRTTLVNAAVQLAGVFSSISAILLAMAEPSFHGEGAQCELTNVQADAMKALFTERNTSCIYNVTVEEVLGRP